VEPPPVLKVEVEGYKMGERREKKRDPFTFCRDPPLLASLQKVRNFGKFDVSMLANWVNRTWTELRKETEIINSYRFKI
jgi:hypothetical protein